LVEDESYTTRTHTREEFLVGLLLNYPEFAEKSLEYIPQMLHSELTNNFVYRQLISYYNDRGSKYTINDFLTTFSDHELQNKLSILALIVAEKYNHFDEEIIENEIDIIAKQLVNDMIQNKLSVIKKDLQIAETNSDKNRKNELLKDQQELIIAYQRINTPNE
jgi:hypothetical protein